MDRFRRPIDASWLVVFRIGFGSLLVVEAVRYLVSGAIQHYYVDPTFHFKYFGFSWVEPWPGIGMHVHFVVMGLLAVAIAIGLLYRLACALYFLSFAYVFLLDQAKYLNHYYLVLILCLLMVFLPAHRLLSVDAKWRPHIRRHQIPAWTLYLMRAQIGIVYFYAGIAKLNGDWLRGEPVRMWMESRAELPVVGSFLTLEPTVYIICYGGLLIDFLSPFFLLWKRTRVAAFSVLLLFHFSNFLLFNIGIFPWLMICATLVFFPPDWPRRWFPRVGAEPETRPPAVANDRLTSARIAAVLLLIHLGFQVFFPLRHFLYPGDVAWTEEGHRFSWRMKLRSKRGWIRFLPSASNGTEQLVPVDGSKHLTPRQLRKMPVLPDMILQFCHFLAAELRHQGYDDVEIRVRALVSLNGREHRLLIDPDVDLASRERSLLPSDWILPLSEPLNRERSSGRASDFEH